MNHDHFTYNFNKYTVLDLKIYFLFYYCTDIYEQNKKQKKNKEKKKTKKKKKTFDYILLTFNSPRLKNTSLKNRGKNRSYVSKTFIFK